MISFVMANGIKLSFIEIKEIKEEVIAMKVYFHAIICCDNAVLMISKCDTCA